MKFRFSGLRDWPLISRFRGAASAASFFLQQATVAFWSHQRLAVWHSSLTLKMSRLFNGTLDMALFSSLTNRFHCFCPSSPFTLRPFWQVSSNVCEGSGTSINEWELEWDHKGIPVKSSETTAISISLYSSDLSRITDPNRYE